MIREGCTGKELYELVARRCSRMLKITVSCEYSFHVCIIILILYIVVLLSGLLVGRVPEESK